MNPQAMRRAPSVRVLVTGAAGLIGGELCARLAERGHGVIALVHRNRAIVRNSGRPLAAMPMRENGPGAGEVACLAGDVRQPSLGLCAAFAATLAGSVDLVVHCAALTGFASTAGEHRAVNVEGTATVLGFARGASGTIPGIVHVSTAYVCGNRSGPIAETALAAAGLADAGSFANTYEETKAEAERLVAASCLRVAVARPSIVVGASDTGAIGRFENIYRLIKLIGSGHIRTLPATPDATLDLVPIDHVVGGLIDIVERFEHAAGRPFHLVSGDPAPVSALVAPIHPGLHVPKLVSPACFDPAKLGFGERSLYRSTTSLYTAYLQRNPRFATHNLGALSGRDCPSAGPELLQKIVNHAVAAGYLTPNAELCRQEALT